MHFLVMSPCSRVHLTVDMGLIIIIIMCLTTIAYSAITVYALPVHIVMIRSLEFRGDQHDVIMRGKE